jgi:hypothetical protein
MPRGLDFAAVEYLNPAAVALCCFSQSPASQRANQPVTCQGVYRGMWKEGIAYAKGDVIYICSDYEEPSSENLWRAVRTHCASEADRPESGVNWRRTWQVRLRPGQPDNLDDLDDGTY